MPLVNSRVLLQQARLNRAAIGHFNVNGTEWITAYLDAAQASQTPIIMATSDRIIDLLGGFDYIHQLVDFFIQAKKITVPIVLHLDHGLSVAHAKQAIDAGYTSVMYDGSQLALSDNVTQTRELVAYAHAHDVTVEAEVGQVGGREDGVANDSKFATVEAAMVMAETGIDSLAAALGSVHGDYRGEPHLNFERMQLISDATNLPLVLHGASGLSDQDLINAIAHGTAKINLNTELNRVWYQTLQQQTSQTTYHNPVEALDTTNVAMQDTVLKFAKRFKSFGRLDFLEE